ncbi:L,D-transpeptidase [Leptolyngbya sp. FACHB-36]|uniref:L,D-transpeptidase n=1 Tax=Leptolyngbya sp. FACHB-36 TaxID=2692808 RepID=UPI0016815655|nr:L,D-transpeptidase [Leptolyngbya sp. FACHB-36]MBD2022575.1 L,D-transpeptidase [Leptolyngbya sp. FACHB-36]
MNLQRCLLPLSSVLMLTSLANGSLAATIDGSQLESILPPALPSVPLYAPTVPATPLTLPLPLLPTADPSAQPSATPAATTSKPLRLEIRLSRRQVTLFRGNNVVKRYPIAIGRPGWETPKGTWEVKQMIKNPAWIHPLKKGVLIPGGDPENPLGRHWIGFWTDGKNWIGFHGTPNPKSVGSAASHGCIRMYNKDIEDLFRQVSPGTPVTVVQ